MSPHMPMSPQQYQQALPQQGLQGPMSPFFPMPLGMPPFPPGMMLSPGFPMGLRAPPSPGYPMEGGGGGGLPNLNQPYSGQPFPLPPPSPTPPQNRELTPKELQEQQEWWRQTQERQRQHILYQQQLHMQQQQLFQQQMHMQQLQQQHVQQQGGQQQGQQGGQQMQGQQQQAQGQLPPPPQLPPQQQGQQLQDIRQQQEQQEQLRAAAEEMMRQTRGGVKQGGASASIEGSVQGSVQGQGGRRSRSVSFSAEPVVDIAKERKESMDVTAAAVVEVKVYEPKRVVEAMNGKVMFDVPQRESLSDMFFPAVVTVRSRARILVSWSLNQSFDRFMHKMNQSEQTSSGGAGSGGGVKMVLGLVRLGISSNKTSVVNKQIFEMRKNTNHPNSGRMEFHAPRSAGIFVFRMFDENNPLVTHSISPPFAVGVQYRDLDHNLKFVIQHLKAKKTAMALRQLTSVFEMLGGKTPWFQVHLNTMNTHSFLRVFTHSLSFNNPRRFIFTSISLSLYLSLSLYIFLSQAWVCAAGE